MHGSFLALCVESKPPWTYRLTSFDRLVDGLLIEGGDITSGDGKGTEFENENIRRVDAAGLVCIANSSSSRYVPSVA
jgi:cyclophilin family peptidyl-prolyl cis-trans isomerase